MFGKLKQAFGIGTVKVVLDIPTTANKTNAALQGTIQLEAQSEQSIQDITVKLIEYYSKGRGSEKRTREFDLGKITLSDAFEMKNGDVKEVKFTLPYQVRKSGNDQLKEYGGALGTLGKLGSMVDAETSEYVVFASLSVKGAVVGPSDRKNINLV